MIADALLTFCDDTALNTGAAGSYIIGNQVDLSVARNIGVGIGEGQLFLVVTVQTTATSGGAATLTIDFVTDDNGSLSSPTVLASSAAIPVASLVQGYPAIVLAVPISDAVERYIGIQQRTGVAAFTAGKINAFLTTTPPARRAYPDGI
jgi:hypothetical protein